MTETELWPAQARQNKAGCTIQIDGLEDWETALQQTVKLDGAWAEEAGGENVTLLQYCKTEARLNNVSIERSVLAQLMEMGYKLQELVIELNGRSEAEWGVCTWIKDHDAYKGKDSTATLLIKDPSEYVKSLFDARFDTEHAGEQEFCLASTQMLGAAVIGQRIRFLFHKTIVFRNVRLTQTKKEAVAA